MYYNLTEAVKRRFIMELRNFWSYHPKYRGIVDHIQGKYSFRERPQMGIVLKTSSANHVVLAADNYQGMVYSYVHTAKVERTPEQGGGVFPGLALEWVREDARAIADNHGLFPSQPGIYYIDILPNGKEFFVDPLIFVEDEPVSQVDPTEFQLQAGQFLANTLRLYEMPGNIELFSPQNYSADPATGIITLTGALPAQASLSADYKYPGTSTGPWAIRENFATNKPVPGVVLVFGRRVEGGDRVAVVVQSARKQAALEYGGRWNVTIDFDVLARDEFAQQEITDRTITWIWAVLRSRLADQGIEIEEVNMGGETEEVYDETGDDYYYNASFSITCQTDWSLHVPLSACIRRVQPNTLEQQMLASSLPDEALAEADLSTIVMVEDLGLNLKNFDDPFFRLGRGGYETIK